MESETIALGTSRQAPDVELTLLAEEIAALHQPGTRFCRVLTSFAFLLKGVPVPVDGTALSQRLAGLEVVGIVATTFGKEGLFAQCGWLGNHDLDWFWARLSDLQSIEIRRDHRFRGGELCVWLGTLHGEYAVGLPHKSYAVMWEQSLSELGRLGLAAGFRQWPAGGTRPMWWDERWKDDWPFEKEAASKRRASADLELQTTVEAGTSSVRPKWVRLGAHGGEQRPGQLRTHLDQLKPWVLEKDGGMPPSVEPQATGAKRKHGKGKGKQ